MDNKPPFGHTMLVDKPLNWTSFDVVNKLRFTLKHLTGKKRNKVGHAGTLDPLATGLLIVCAGSHTKKIETMMGMTKTYTGTIKLGATTPSFDLETAFDQTYAIPPRDEPKLQSTAQSFLGNTEQIPPIFSAKKVGGKKAYELARKGKEVTMELHQIHISQFDIDTTAYPEIAFEISCSKGTYIRSIAHDFGIKLGFGAHLSSLRRSRVGNFKIDGALSIDQAKESLKIAYTEYLNDN